MDGFCHGKFSLWDKGKEGQTAGGVRAWRQAAPGDFPDRGGEGFDKLVEMRTGEADEAPISTSGDTNDGYINYLFSTYEGGRKLAIRRNDGKGAVETVQDERPGRRGASERSS